MRDIEESRKTSISKVARSDPQMIEISLFEIQSFLIAENSAKFVLLIGTLFVGGLISTYLSKIYVNPIIIIVSISIFIFGLILDVYLTYTKFKELKQKGAEKWQ